MATTTKPFPQLPEPGDFVWCRFPRLPGFPDTPGPKLRPALVIAVSDADHEVMVVYGTSQKTDKIYPTEFLLKRQMPVSLYLDWLMIRSSIWQFALSFPTIVTGLILLLLKMGWLRCRR